MSQNLDPTKSETSLPREMLCLRMLVRPKMTKATSDRATTNSKQFDRLMWVLRSELEDLWGLNPILWSGTSSVTSSSARRTKASVSWSLSSISRVATSPLVSIKTHQPNDFPHWTYLSCDHSCSNLGTPRRTRSSTCHERLCAWNMMCAFSSA